MEQLHVRQEGVVWGFGRQGQVSWAAKLSADRKLQVVLLGKQVHSISLTCTSLSEDDEQTTLKYRAFRELPPGPGCGDAASFAAEFCPPQRQNRRFLPLLSLGGSVAIWTRL